MADKGKKGSMSASLLNKLVGPQDSGDETATAETEGAAAAENKATVAPEASAPAAEPAVNDAADDANPDQVLTKKGARGKAEKRSAATYNVRPSQSEALKKIAFMTKRSISDVVEEAFAHIIAENEEKIAKYDKIRELLDT